MKIKTQDSPEVWLHCIEGRSGQDAPVILLLHGFPEFWYAWNDYLDPLSQAGFHPVAIDLRGYNLSSKPEEKDNYEMSVLVEDIKKVIQHFNKKTFIVGHDWGGIITMELAAKYPELCEGIVVMNAPHPGAKFPLMQYLKLWYAGLFQLPTLPEKVLKAFNYKIIGEMLQTESLEYIDNVKQAVSNDNSLTCMLNYYRANFHIVAEKKMKKISVPSMLMWGEQDVALDKRVAKSMDQFFSGPFSKHFFREASHWVHRECRHEILDLIIPFFKANNESRNIQL